MRFLSQAHRVLGLVALLTLVACAGNPDAIPVGTNRDAVLSTLGQPTAIWTITGGERLQYSRQPGGQQVYNVDLDNSARVVTAAQVMTQAAFAAVQIDAWRTQDVLRAFGKPALIARVYSFDGIVWSYRYAEPFGPNKQFHVFIDSSGMVRRTQVTDEPDLIDDRIGAKQ